MTRKPRKATPQSLHNAALFYLERFSTSAENLRRVMIRRVERSVRIHETDRAEGLAAVDELIARFRKSGLLDDRGLEDCIACRLCELRCPDLAIEVLVAKTTEEKVS